MDHEEEQMMEIEALEAIYMDDFKAESATHFEVVLKPHVDGGDDENHDYTPNYPEELPEIDVRIEKGLTEAQLCEIDALARSTAEENLDMAMIFTIAEAIKEWLIDNNVRALTEHEQILERKKIRKGTSDDAGIATSTAANDAGTRGKGQAGAVIDDGEQPIIEGTIVTPENFEEWKLAFNAELRNKWKKEDDAAVDLEKAKRLTGKQYFELNSGSAAFLAAIEAEEAQQKDNIVIDEDLYGDDDEEELDSADSDDDKQYF